MNTDQLQSFIFVVDSASFHQAAEALFLSQPSVTARIKELEQELGAPLFKRKGRGTVLTNEGKAFLPYAKKVLVLTREGKNVVAGMSMTKCLAERRS